MINPFDPGAKKHYEVTVQEADTAKFPAEEVHPVYATFALARDVEWTCRLFVHEMKEKGEEGIGTMLHIDHVSPALEHSKVTIEATLQKVEKNELICSFEAKVGDRIVAKGEQGQKIVLKSKIDQIFSNLNQA